MICIGKKVTAQNQKIQAIVWFCRRLAPAASSAALLPAFGRKDAKAIAEMTSRATPLSQRPGRVESCKVVAVPVYRQLQAVGE